MMKNECKIVKDLLPNYIEDLTSKETNEFLENHIETCKDCKEILKMLKGDKEEEEQKEEKSEEEELKHLKKYNRRMLILKIIAVLLALFIIIALPITIPKKKKYDEAYAKGEYVYNIIQVAKNKLEELKNEKNLEVSVENIPSINNESKYKYIYKFKDEKFSYINITYFNNDNQYNQIFKKYGIKSENMTQELGINEDVVTTILADNYNDTWDMPISNIDVFDNLSIIDCSVVKVMEEEFNRKKLLCTKIWNRRNL